MSDAKRYWIPGPLTNYGTTANGFAGEVLVVAAVDYGELERDLRDATIEADRVHNEHAEMIDSYEAKLEEYERRIDELQDEVDSSNQLIDKSARLAEAERDAARIEWLASNPRGGQIVVDGKTQDCVFWGISGHPRATLRDAIDAARATDSATPRENV